jgi:uncharacterized membrane protein YsdA (DUF1294 family)
MHYLPIIAFAGIYLAADLAWAIPPALALVYLGASLACFTAYAIDKSAARSRGRRTPERTLLLLGLACGWPGAVLAQQWLRHKSSKASFRARFWLTVLANVGLFAAFGWWWGSPGNIFIT